MTPSSDGFTGVDAHYFKVCVFPYTSSSGFADRQWYDRVRAQDISGRILFFSVPALKSSDPSQ